MSIARRVLAAVAALFLLSWLPALPAAAAGPMVATIDDQTSMEHELQCNPSTPGPCTVRYARRVLFNITVSNFSGPQITFGFQLESITAILGQDFAEWPFYSPPHQITTGTDGKAQIRADMIVDSVTEPTETYRLRLTSASRPVDITDTGLGTILDGNQLPPDCAASVVSDFTGSMTCSSRPAGQQWRARFQCADFPPPWASGNIVTGNGTSNATCLYDSLLGGVAFVIVA